MNEEEIKQLLYATLNPTKPCQDDGERARRYVMASVLSHVLRGDY